MLLALPRLTFAWLLNLSVLYSPAEGRTGVQRNSVSLKGNLRRARSDAMTVCRAEISTLLSRRHALASRLAIPEYYSLSSRIFGIPARESEHSAVWSTSSLLSMDLRPTTSCRSPDRLAHRASSWPSGLRSILVIPASWATSSRSASSPVVFINRIELLKQLRYSH